MDKPSLDTLGRHLQQLRLSRGISLSQLAQDAGIAKSNLSRLEQGAGNPTLDTIWRLSLSLKVPFGTLIAPVQVPVGDEGVQVRLIAQGHDEPAVDAYWFSCAPEIYHRSEPHGAGTQEQVTLISGELTVGNAQAQQVLRAGDTYQFAADQTHFYQSGEQWVSAVLTIVYPPVAQPPANQPAGVPEHD